MTKKKFLIYILKAAHSQRIPNIRNQIQHCPLQCHASALVHYVSTLWRDGSSLTSSL